MQLNSKLNRQDSKGSFYAGLLFLIWPFLATISAFRNYKKPWAKNIFWAFCAFYGFTFAIGAESQGSDIVRYVSEYQALHGNQMTFSLALEYFKESGEADVLRTFLAVVLSRFTDSQPVLTLVYGIIFGYFFSRNLWYIIQRLEGKLMPITSLLLVCFFLVNPIWNINGFRMWTATHIFIFGLLPFLFEGKKKGLMISTLSILVHFSFIVPVSILFLYLLLGNRLLLFFIFFIGTFFISEIDVTFFNDLVENYAPEIVQERSESYRDERTVENFREPQSQSSNLNWYAIWYKKALNWSVVGFLGILFFKARSFFEENKAWLNLFSFTLFFYGVANILSSLPAGSRYYIIANLCALALITLYVQNQPREKMMKRFVLVATPALLLFVIVSIRASLLSLSATSILGNPLLALFTAGDNIALNEFLRMVF